MSADTQLEGACSRQPAPRAQGRPCRGASPGSGSTALVPPVSDGSKEALGVGRSRKTCPTVTRSTNQSIKADSELTQMFELADKDIKTDVIIAFSMLRKVSRNMEDTLKTKIKL